MQVNDRDLIREIGLALWGPDWRARFASAVRQQPSTVSNWESGSVPVPAAAWKEIREVVRQHALNLAELDPRIVASFDSAYQREMKNRI